MFRFLFFLATIATKGNCFVGATAFAAGAPRCFCGLLDLQLLSLNRLSKGRTWIIWLIFRACPLCPYPRTRTKHKSFPPDSKNIKQKRSSSVSRNVAWSLFYIVFCLRQKLFRLIILRRQKNRAETTEKPGCLNKQSVRNKRRTFP